MAIPIGTTARQLESVARWGMAGIVVVGMLSWATPGGRTWGALVVGLLAVWALWLIGRIVLGDRTIPFHPAYLALIGPVLILTFHAAAKGLGNYTDDPTDLAAAVEVSMIFHLWLLGMGVLLSRSLLPRAVAHPIVVSLCGLAMMAGPLLAVALGQASAAKPALALTGFAGAGVWLSPIWTVSALDRSGPAAGRARNARIARLLIAGVGVAGLGWLAPVQALLAVGVVAGVMLAGAIILPAGRWKMLAAAAVLGAVALAGARRAGLGLELHGLKPGLFGLGEDAFGSLAAGDTGLAVLVGTVGWVGAAWLVIGLVGGGVYLLIRARHRSAVSGGRVIVWMVSAALTATAMLGAGGLFIPSVTLAAVLTWGLAPAMLGLDRTRLNGLWVLGAMIALMLLLGLSRHGGLAERASLALGGSDRVMHAMAGFFLAMVVAWLAGVRRVWLGLIGIVGATLAGGAAEVLQGALSRRNMQMADWLAHAVGCAIATPLYLLCVASRWCESRDAGGGGLSESGPDRQ